MQNKFFLVITILSLAITAAEANPLDDSIQSALTAHYTANKNKEYFSGISLAIYKPGQPLKKYFVGNVAHDAGSPKINAATLFNIGSITKSFTAAIVLQLEKENQLKLSDTLQQWLPDYAKWSTVTLHSMLDMTSGLPNYSDTPLMNAEEFKNYQRQWSATELLSYVYPAGNFAPPLRAGYNYTNTGYILMEMIIEKITKQSFKHAIETRLFTAAGLHETFYPLPMTSEVTARLAHGYAYNPYSNPEIIGKDMQLNNLSWAGAAGAVISTPADIIKWTQALFIDNKILDAAQKAKLEQLVSTTTGKAIKETSLIEPRAFGLGVSQGFNKKYGKFWFYEGQTEGFHALFMYVPATGVIISCIFNSAVNAENDHAGDLMNKIYEIFTA